MQTESTLATPLLQSAVQIVTTSETQYSLNSDIYYS